MQFPTWITIAAVSALCYSAAMVTNRRWPFLSYLLSRSIFGTLNFPYLEKLSTHPNLFFILIGTIASLLVSSIIFQSFSLLPFTDSILTKALELAPSLPLCH